MPFSVENDLLTPSFKIKRPQAAKFYRKEIDNMYKVLSSKHGKEPSKL